MYKLCFLIILSIVAKVFSAVAIYPYEPKPPGFEDQDGCWIQDLKRVLPYNEPYYPKGENSCLQYTCGTNNETQLVSCGVLQYPDNCHLVKDFTLDYPKCCGTLVCDPTTETPSTKITTEATTAPCEQPTTRKPKVPKTPKPPKSPKDCESPKLPVQPSPPRYKLPVEKIKC